MFIDNIKYIASQSQAYRAKFGNLRGLLLWAQTRQNYKLEHGSLYSVAVPRLKHNIFLRAGTSDIAVFNQIILSGETDFELDSEPTFIVDAGANIGLSSIVLAARYPNSKIVALEVESENFDLLCRNVKPYPNVAPVRKALWRNDESVKILNPTAEAWAFQVVETAGDDPDAIAAVSLKTLLSENASEEISLLKLDIEGGEVEVLSCEPESWINCTKVLAVELHDRYRPGCTDALESLLSGRPNRQYRQGEYRVVHFALR